MRLGSGGEGWSDARVGTSEPSSPSSPGDGGAKTEAKEPPSRGVHEAHHPVGLVDQEVPDEAYVLVVGVEELAVDQVAWREEYVSPPPCVIHNGLLLIPNSPRGPSDGHTSTCCHPSATSAPLQARRGCRRSPGSGSAWRPIALG